MTTRRKFIKQSAALTTLTMLPTMALTDPLKQDNTTDTFPIKWWEMKPIPFTIPDDYYPDGLRLSDSPRIMEKKYRDGIRTFIYIYEQFRENGKLENLDSAFLTVKSKHKSVTDDWGITCTSENLMKQLMQTGHIFNTWRNEPQMVEDFKITLHPIHRPLKIELECMLCSNIIREYAFSTYEEHRSLVELEFGFYEVNPHKPKFYSPIHLPSNPISVATYDYYKKFHAIPPSNIGEKWCKYVKNNKAQSDMEKFLEQYEDKGN